jgi:hypothetical protein
MAFMSVEHFLGRLTPNAGFPHGIGIKDGSKPVCLTMAAIITGLVLMILAASLGHTLPPYGIAILATGGILLFSGGMISCCCYRKLASFSHGKNGAPSSHSSHSLIHQWKSHVPMRMTQERAPGENGDIDESDSD